MTDSMQIEIEGKRISIDTQWDRQQAQDELEKRCLTLSNLTVDHEQPSLVICLIQHLRGCFWLTNMKEAYNLYANEGVTQAEWWNFRDKLLQLQHRQNVDEDVKKAVEDVVSLLTTFPWLQRTNQQGSIRVKCFGVFGVFAVVENPPGNRRIEGDDKYFHVWYDSKTGTFHSISKGDLEVCVNKCFHDFFVKQLTKPGDEDVDDIQTIERNSSNFIQDLERTNSSTKDVDSLLNRWEVDQELRLNVNYVIENYKAESNAVEEWAANSVANQQMLELLHQSLSESIRKAFSDRSDRCDEAEKQIQLENKWKQLELKWCTRHPLPYELVVQRLKHPLFSIDNAAELVEEMLKTFDERQHQDELTEELRSWNSDGAVVEKVHRYLREMVSAGPKFSWHADLGKMVVSGEALVFSEILSHRQYLPRLGQIREIHVNAGQIIYIDADWKTPGVNLALSSPNIKVVGSSSSSGRAISTSGRNGQNMPGAAQQLLKASNGSGPGLSGSNGTPGDPGESAGNVQIQCDHFDGQLRIEANGGNGAKGQDGGDGARGKDGKDGQNGSLPEYMETSTWYLARTGKGLVADFGLAPSLLFVFPFVAPFVELRGIVPRFKENQPNTNVYGKEGKKGEAGTGGGNGGNGGAGGSGGQKGTFTVICRNGSIDSYEVEAENGRDGLDGQPGKPGEGGSGGKNGYDIFRVFEPDVLDPEMKVSGKWVTEWGRVRVHPIFHRNGSNYKIGNRLEKLGDDNGRAADGRKGRDGQKADHQQRKLATAKEAIGDVSKCHWKTASTEQEHKNLNEEFEEKLRKNQEEFQRIKATDRRMKQKLESSSLSGLKTSISNRVARLQDN